METPSTEAEEELSEYFRQYEDPINSSASAPNMDIPLENNGGLRWQLPSASLKSK